MGKLSLIEWTDDTFNPWIGCTKVSPACQNCYAECLCHRRKWVQWGKGKPRLRTSKANWNQPLKWNEEARESGRRRRVFCASLADVFDAEVPSQWRSDLWQLVCNTPYLDWLILTKRPENIAGMLPPDWKDGWPNVCLMTSVEDQERSTRVECLLQVPAQYRGLSIEPLLGPIDLDPTWMEKLNWIIVGGESQKEARPTHPDWVRSIRDQCQKHGVHFFFKQWGCWSPDWTCAKPSWVNAAYFASPTNRPILLSKVTPVNRKTYRNCPTGTLLFRVMKKKSGRLLDGQCHDDHPFGKRIPKREIIQPLTDDEKKHLRKCEKTIHKGLGTFVEVGTALADIRNKRLYRLTHSTFEEYVQAVLLLSRPYAYSVMESAEVMRDLSSIEDIPLPANEGQARELRRWKTAEERIEKWRSVVKAANGYPLTAKLVREVLCPTGTETKVKVSNKNDLGACIAKLRALASQLPIKEKAWIILDDLERSFALGDDAERGSSPSLFSSGTPIKGKHAA